MMGNTTITLTRDEMFEAIFDYVRKNYPQVISEQASIKKDFHGKISHVEVTCRINKHY